MRWTTLAPFALGIIAGCAGGETKETSGQGGEGGATTSSSTTAGQGGEGGAGGGGSACTGDGACDDQDPCTVDACASMQCAHEPAPAGTPCGNELACDPGGACDALAATFSKAFGGPGYDVAGAVAVDSKGNIILAGSFEQSVDFGGGPLTSAGLTDIFVVKLDSSGNHVFSKAFGGAGTQGATAVAVDASDNILVVGATDGSVNFGGGALPAGGDFDVFVAKLDAQGGHVWSHHYGGAGKQQGESVAVDASGNVILAGRFEGGVDFGTGPLLSAGTTDVFITKLNASGGLVFASRFGDAGIQIAPNVAVDAAGSILATGGFEGSVDFGGAPLVSAGGLDVFILKLGADGKHLWSQRAGDASNLQTSSDILADSAGNVIVTGTLVGSMDFGGGALSETGGTDAFLVKLDADGKHLWSKDYGDSAAQAGLSIAVRGDDSLALAGLYGGVIDFGGAQVSAGADALNLFLAALDPSGDPIFRASSFAEGQHRVYGAAVDAGGNVIITGYYTDLVGFGNGDLPKAASADIFIAKYPAKP